MLSKTNIRLFKKSSPKILFIGLRFGMGGQVPN